MERSEVWTLKILYSEEVINTVTEIFITRKTWRSTEENHVHCSNLCQKNKQKTNKKKKRTITKTKSKKQKAKSKKQKQNKTKQSIRTLVGNHNVTLRLPTSGVLIASVNVYYQ